MCLIGILADERRARLISDGTVSNAEGQPISRDFSKLFRMPGGQVLSVTGEAAAVRFAQELQTQTRGTPEVWECLQAYCEEHPSGAPAGFALVGLDEKLRVFIAGKPSPDEWQLGEFPAAGFSMIDGFFDGDIAAELQSVGGSFEQRWAGLRQIFDRILQENPERTGGEIFIEEIRVPAAAPDGANYSRTYKNFNQYITPAGAIPSSTFMKAQGSILALADNTGFQFSATTSSLSFWFTGRTVYMQDGSNYVLPVTGSSGSPAWTFTGLSASTTYYFGAYYNIADGTVHLVMSDNTTASGSQQWVVQTINGDGRLALFASWAVPTPSSGTAGGGGSSGGGGGKGDYY